MKLLYHHDIVTFMSGSRRINKAQAAYWKKDLFENWW